MPAFLEETRVLNTYNIPSNHVIFRQIKPFDNTEIEQFLQPFKSASQNFEPAVSSIKASKDKIYRNTREIWLLPGIIFLGSAAIAIAYFIIFTDAPNQSDKQNQNLALTTIPASVKP
ncbi:MAG: hypothetical protein V7K94_06625 [Nostoc sp.]|uniref:hypothetical protein n=1 Tax=Nostoc sp. TaxID=1180 RepID=UPI002FF9F9EB